MHKRPITITVTNTIDSWCDCPISSDSGRLILRLVPGHIRSQSKVRCVLHVGAPSWPFRRLSHCTFLEKERLWPSLVLALSKIPSLFTAPAEDSLKNKRHIWSDPSTGFSGPGDWSKTLTFQLCMYQLPWRIRPRNLFWKRSTCRIMQVAGIQDSTL